MEYLIVGKTVYIAHFYEGLDELANSLSKDEIGVFELEGVSKVVWGEEGEDWCELMELISKVLT